MRRLFQFFRDVKSEMYKVVWPSRKDAIRYTLTVIVFSLVVSGILGAADYGLFRLFEKLITK